MEEGSIKAYLFLISRRSYSGSAQTPPHQVLARLEEGGQDERMMADGKESFDRLRRGLVHKASYSEFDTVHRKDPCCINRTQKDVLGRERVLSLPYDQPTASGSAGGILIPFAMG